MNIKENTTEATQMLAEVYKELETSNADSKEYLEDYFKNNEENITNIKEFEKVFSSGHVGFYARIYDLAIYDITNRLINKIDE